MKHAFHHFDSVITKWIALAFGQRARPFFLFVTSLGDPIAIGVITAILFGIGVYLSDTTLIINAAAIPITVLIGAALKLLFERARPTTEYTLNMKLQTFSFPSGHSSGSMITYGLLAIIAIGSQTPLSVVIGCLLATLPILVGISRVYLGAHFPTDVLAGWALGALSLILLFAVVRPLL